jgi:hypothetical protein
MAVLSALLGLLGHVTPLYGFVFTYGNAGFRVAIRAQWRMPGASRVCIDPGQGIVPRQIRARLRLCWAEGKKKGASTWRCKECHGWVVGQFEIMALEFDRIMPGFDQQPRSVKITDKLIPDSGPLTRVRAIDLCQ